MCSLVSPPGASPLVFRAWLKPRYTLGIPEYMKHVKQGQGTGDCVYGKLGPWFPSVGFPNAPKVPPPQKNLSFTTAKTRKSRCS